MRREDEQGELHFKVFCSWCGVIIRRTSTKDSHGMCLKCYSRMLGERGHARWQGDATSNARQR
jgi:hypothetical protein